MFMTTRTRFGILFVCAACATHGATVVHDAARDLVLNSQNANVYTNVYGGVWSYMRSSSNTGPRTLLPGVRSRTSTEKDASGGNDPAAEDQLVIWQRGPALSQDSSPVISVNPTAWPDTKDFMRGSDWPTIPPGGLSCHPGKVAGIGGFVDGNQCVVLRFTTPRDGTYAVTAKAWNQNSGRTAVTLLVNGEVRRERRAWTSTKANVTTNDFSLAAATYAAGDIIELAVDGDGTYAANATGLDFRIAEEVEAAYDASTGFRANLDAEHPANPYADSFGAWSGAYAAATPTNASRSLFNNVAYVRATQGNVLSGMAVNSSYPYLVANRSDAMVVETNSAGTALTVQGRGYLPGELMAQPPGGARAFTVLQVTPANGGIYDVGLSVRDMYYGSPNAAGNGVNVWLLQGSVVLARTFVSIEASHSSESVFIKGLKVFPQIPLAVAVDNNGAASSDGTAIMWAFVRTGDFSATYYANAAMKANMTSASPTNPFTHNGATWTAGLCADGWKGTFTPYAVNQKRYNDWFSGWSDNATASPFWAINLKDGELTPGEMGSVLGAGTDMMLVHPKNDNTSTALRFTAPADGVYSATAWLADLAHDTSKDNNSADDGVGVHLVAEGHRADSAVVKLQKLPTGQEARRLAADRIFLRKDETMTFAVGRNGANGWDLTGSFIWIDPESDAAALQGVNIDLDCKGAGRAYAGTGRVGYAGETWNGLAVGNGASGCTSKHLYAASGTRTGVTLALSNADRPLSASAANSATDTTAASLFSDGVVSTSSADVNAFTLAGLLPRAKYELYFYSRALTEAPPATATSIVRGVFAVGGTTAVSEKTWFADEFGDYARIDAVSDAAGTVTGTFRSASADAAAFWCGLQILGPGFSPYIPTGTSIIFR